MLAMTDAYRLTAAWQMAAVDDRGDVSSKGPANDRPVERVSFLPSPAAAESPAPGPAKDADGKAGGGEGIAGQAPAKPPLAAKIQKEVSAPLAGVQTALIMDVPLWEHTKTFRSLSHGLYVMPKARCRHVCRTACSSGAQTLPANMAGTGRDTCADLQFCSSTNGVDVFATVALESGCELRRWCAPRLRRCWCSPTACRRWTWCCPAVRPHR